MLVARKTITNQLAALLIRYLTTKWPSNCSKTEALGMAGQRPFC